MSPGRSGQGLSALVLLEGSAGEVVEHAEGDECDGGPYVDRLYVAGDEGDEESGGAAGGGCGRDS